MDSLATVQICKKLIEFISSITRDVQKFFFAAGTCFKDPNFLGHLLLPEHRDGNAS